MPEIIIIRGPLGIGKTTIAKKLADELSAGYFSIDEVLEKNNLDKVKNNIPVENFLKVNKILVTKIKKLFDVGKTSIIDGNFYYKEAIENLEKALPKKPKIFSLTCPLSVCIARDASRKNSHGQLAARAVYDLVSRLEYGQEIKANEKSVKEIIVEIKDNL